MLIEENPYFDSYDYNPRRRKRKNPGSKALALPLPKAIQRYTMGVDVKDAIGASLGLVMAGAIPGMIIKNATTTMNKVLTLVVAGGTALVAGMVAKTALGQSAGRSAIIGGLGGVTIQIVKTAFPKQTFFKKSLGGGQLAGLIGNNNNDKIVIGG